MYESTCFPTVSTTECVTILFNFSQFDGENVSLWCFNLHFKLWIQTFFHSWRTIFTLFLWVVCSLIHNIKYNMLNIRCYTIYILYGIIFENSFFDRAVFQHYCKLLCLFVKFHNFEYFNNSFHPLKLFCYVQWILWCITYQNLFSMCVPGKKKTISTMRILKII